MDESSTLCMTQFDYQRTKETKLKATYTLVKIRSQLFLQVRSTGRGKGRVGKGGGRADWRDNSLQQMSTSLGGRAINDKVLKAGDVSHVTHSTRNRVSLLTHQDGTNFYCVRLHSARKDTPRHEQECG